VSPRQIALLIILTIAALGSWYLAREDHSDNGGTTSQNAAHRGYYLKSARILGTGPDGNLLYEVLAERAEQREDTRIEFTDVLINYSPDSEIPWSVNADKALVDQDLPQLLLSGHVRAISSEGFAGKDTEIRTEVLELDPENYTARTDERVQIRIGERSLTATGMLASLKENQVQLVSNVSGKFLP
jgi:lipopolysaccharide export system protein LptC